jgi:purine-binding chemotaxis protein CheW
MTASGAGEARATHDTPWVLVRLGAQLFGIDAMHVQEMVSTPTVQRVPQTPAHVRGVVNLRGQVLSLVDLRQRFGMRSQADELAELTALLTERERDHARWIDELEASVRERRRFTLTTDPHACAFGRWYDTFKTDNLMLETVLKRFAEPHAALHAAGHHVVERSARGDWDGCGQVIADAKGGVAAHLAQLFSDARAALADSNREIAVVLRADDLRFALAVDGIESVERIDQAHICEAADVLHGIEQDLVSAVARRTRDNALLMLVTPKALFG